MLPTQQLLEKVSQEIMSVPNRRKESKRKVHYGLFLLGYKSGLRVNEAVNFDLENKTKKGLYRIQKPKGKKERLVYIPKEVIQKLKKINWKPNQTNRWNFYHFLRKIKRELNIGKEIELSPHTLCHAFATYQAESGLPLPILQKLLGHSSIRTTSLYWKNIYQDPDSEVGPILVGKNWLEKKKPPITEIFPEIPKNPKPIFIEQKSLIPNKNPTHENNSLSTPKTLKKTPGILTNGTSAKEPEKFLLNSVDKKSDQSKTNQPLTIVANKKGKLTDSEVILLAKIKSLENQLAQIQAENNNLKSENQHLKALVQQFQARQNLVGEQEAETKTQIIQLTHF